MKKIIIFLLFLASGLTAQGQASTTISKFEGAKITGAIISGAFDVRLSQGAATGVKVQVREDLASKVTVEMTEDGNVRLNYGSDVGKFFTGKNKPMVEIVVSELKYLQLAGVTTLIAKGEFTATGKSVIQIEGSAKADFINIEAPEVSVVVGGSAIVDMLAVDTESLKIEATTASKVMIKGQAAKVDMTSSGTATLDALSLQCPNITATTLGMSATKATVSGVANVKSGGTSTFKYSGDGKVEGDGKRL